ncbi:MAG TPA: MFS transporter [Thermoleophilia bacterium]|nr:MFS transporter [Thermoleophilia bacterium]
MALPHPRRWIAQVKTLDPNVRTLGLVSMLADLSSEIGYVIFPFFITGVLGAPVALLGLIEGIAEATASITKYPFGQAADRSGRRKPFVLGGYTLGALGKLVIALAPGWGIALVGRTTDRFGKGMRTAPRDDLIAANTDAGQQGLAFGLHRSMDTIGAILGPLAAIVMLETHVPWRWMFAIAVVPGLFSVLVIMLLVKEHREAPQRHAFRISLPASPAFRWLLAGSLLFAAGNSSDTFLILRAKDLVGGSLYHAAIGATLLYVLYNIVYAAGSLPLGGLSDRVGQYPVVIAGYVVFALVYAGFAAAGSVAALAGLFAAYGLYIAATEGTSKALIGRAIPTGQRASALGLYSTATGLATFAASTIGGALWTAFGSWATFAFGAAAAVAAALLMLAGRGRVRRALETAGQGITRG